MDIRQSGPLLKAAAHTGQCTPTHLHKSSHLAGRMQDAKSIVQFVHLLQHSLTLADMKQARMLQAT